MGFNIGWGITEELIDESLGEGVFRLGLNLLRTLTRG